MAMVAVYITCRDKKEAEKISLHLLNKRMIACTNIFPISSFYWWDNKIEKSSEVVVIAKTVGRNYEKIKKEIKKIHSYKVPCIMKINADANKEYSDWIEKEVKQKTI